MLARFFSKGPSGAFLVKMHAMNLKGVSLLSSVCASSLPRMNSFGSSSVFRYFSHHGGSSQLNDFVVKGAQELKDGDMMEVKVGERNQDKILVAKLDGKYHAAGNFCTHFGAPLGNSILIDDKVICPWHYAAFSVNTGKVEQSPAFAGLPTYETEVDKDGALHVQLPAQLPRSDGHKSIGKRDPNNAETYVIVGGGPAGLSAAETLRGSGFTGRILVITSENSLPYDRTLLSKGITGASVPNLLLRSAEFLENSDIEYKLGSTVVSTNAKEKEVILDDDSRVKYDKLLAVSGGSVRVPPVPGVQLNGVHTVRNSVDFGKTKAALAKAKEVVIVGASFIGMESAGSLKRKRPDINITILDFFEFPFQRVLGAQIGAGVKELCETKDLTFHMGDGVKEILGNENGHVKSILMSSGKQIPCDTVLVGAGIHPQTGYLKNTGVEFMPDTSVKVDGSFKAGDGIYAAGDIATYPDLMRDNKLSRFEHWGLAIQTGAYAALGMLGKSEAFRYVPFFWTWVWDKPLQYVGHSMEWDDFFMLGEINKDKQDFMAFYLKKGKIEAAAGMNRGRKMMTLAEAIRLGIPPSAEQIKSAGFDFSELEAQVKEKARAEKAGCTRCNYRLEASSSV